jgi:molybdenum cofactor cytidylyltransferase
MSDLFLILAAGASSRMGSPKALLELDGEALVVRAARLVREAGAEPLVVTGAHDGPIREVLGGVACVHNPLWAEGMGGSIAAGMRAVGPHVERVGVMAVDQPGVTAQALRALLNACVAPWEASSCVYEGVGAGIPAVFGRSMHDALRALCGAEGARGLLRDERRAVALVAGVVGLDVDTPEAWRRFLEVRDAQG